MNPDFADVLGNANYLFSMHPAPWSFYEKGIDGFVQDANGKFVFGGEYCEGFVSKEDLNIVALVDTVNSLAVWMKQQK